MITSSSAEPWVGTEDPATSRSYRRRQRWTMSGAGARIADRQERGNPPVPPRDEEATTAFSKETARIEAFSDGVFAIAITLLILDIKVPHPSQSSVGLGTQLLRQWPSYVAFLASFATIGIMWINHHRLFTLIIQSSHALLLLGIVVVPFPTALVAEYFGHKGEHLAAMVFSATFLFIAVIFNVLWRYAVKHALGHNAKLPEVREISKQYRFGPLFYVFCLLLAPFSVGASIGISLALAIFFAL